MKNDKRNGRSPVTVLLCASLLCAVVVTVYANNAVYCNGACEPDGCSCCCKEVKCFHVSSQTCYFALPGCCFNDCADYEGAFRAQVNNPPAVPDVCDGAIDPRTGERARYTSFSVDSCEFLCQNCGATANDWQGENQNCQASQVFAMPVLSVCFAGGE